MENDDPCSKHTNWSVTNRSSSTSSSSSSRSSSSSSRSSTSTSTSGGGRAQKVLKANYLPDLWVRSCLKLPSTTLLDATRSVYEKHKISSFLMQPSPPMAPWIRFMRSAFRALKCLMLESWSKWAPQKWSGPRCLDFSGELPSPTYPTQWEGKLIFLTALWMRYATSRKKKPFRKNKDRPKNQRWEGGWPFKTEIFTWKLMKNMAPNYGRTFESQQDTTMQHNKKRH